MLVAQRPLLHAALQRGLPSEPALTVPRALQGGPGPGPRERVPLRPGRPSLSLWAVGLPPFTITAHKARAGVRPGLLGPVGGHLPSLPVEASEPRRPGQRDSGQSLGARATPGQRFPRPRAVTGRARGQPQGHSQVPVLGPRRCHLEPGAPGAGGAAGTSVPTEEDRARRLSWPRRPSVTWVGTGTDHAARPRGARELTCSGLGATGTAEPSLHAGSPDGDTGSGPAGQTEWGVKEGEGGPHRCGTQGPVADRSRPQRPEPRLRGSMLGERLGGTPGLQRPCRAVGGPAPLRVAGQ